MGITCKLKQISISILENIKEDPLLLNLLFEAKWLPESELWLKLVTYRQDPNRAKNHDDLKALEFQLLSEWETPEEGFQERYRRESEKANPLPWIDWDEEEMLDWMTDYFNEIQDYYTDTCRNKKAMLLYLI
jgi:hypothetical protein